jgi:lipopolysaccharide/colanic/teichoic acid biosynthesis glycosyltransferase/glycosyltransferase involved in cell wall biosynthesis
VQYPPVKSKLSGVERGASPVQTGMCARMDPRVVFMTTSPKALRSFFQTQIRFLSSAGFGIQVISSPGDELEDCRWNLGLPMHAIRMHRRISPLADLAALVRLVLKLRQLRPAMVHTHTPKAGLLGMLAARLAGVPIRIYTINGLRFSTTSGLRRKILMAADKLGCALATDVFCVSRSLSQQAVALGVCSTSKVRTLGSGGSHGVDTGVFDPGLFSSEDRRDTRARFSLPQDAVVLSYIGRLVRDKGIIELSAAWKVLREEFPTLRLLLCGPPEEEDPLPPETLRELQRDSRVCMTGVIRSNMAAIHAVTDICVLPSYREGLPNIALEAQAMRVPVVATRIPGTIDAVRGGVTGLLVAPRDPVDLARALRRLIQDGELRTQMGAAGREFVSQHFEERRLSELLASEYRRLLAARCPRLSAVNRSVPRLPRVGRIFKTAFDTLAAAAVLALSAPLLVPIGIALRRSTGATAILRQTRAGLGGRPFTMYKLRTMTEARDEFGNLLPDPHRLTLLGRAARAISLDELPQLWNVLRGEMSLVGPRPLIVRYLSRYNSSQARRHDVRPGITGWAQVNGRNTLSWEKKFALDVWYVDNWSLWLDCKILCMTLMKVLSRADVSPAGQPTPPEFTGS